MLSTLIFVLLSLTLGTHAARFKANEYKTYDCSGDSNYPHRGSVEVTMDDSSHSVYLAVPGDDQYVWQAFEGKTMNNGACTGHVLGNLTTGADACNNLHKFGTKIKCVKYCSIKEGPCKHLGENIAA